MSSLDLSIPLDLPAEKPLVPVLHRTNEEHVYTFRIDNSTLERAQTCPKSAEYYVFNRRQRPGRSALLLGGAVHAGLEVLYRDGFGNIDVAVSRAQQHFGHSFHTADDWRTPEFAGNVLRKYAQYWEDKENLSPHFIDGVPQVERSFEIELGTIDIDDTVPFTYRQLFGYSAWPSAEHVYIKTLRVVWIGRIDLIAAYYDSMSILDHKTTSMLGDTFYNQFVLGQQPIGYCWSASKLLKTRIRQFWLNVLALRPPSKTGTSIAFERRLYTYTDEQLDEWERDTMTLISDLWSHALRGNFPRSRVWCMGKYGSCPYFEVCTLPDSQRMAMLQSTAFANVDWDPTNKD